MTQDPTTTPPLEAAPETRSGVLDGVLIAVTLAVAGLVVAAWVFALITLGRSLVSALF